MEKQVKKIAASLVNFDGPVYIAKDHNGDCFVYLCKPDLDQFYWYSGTNFDIEIEIPSSLKDVDWKDSLREVDFSC